MRDICPDCKHQFTISSEVMIMLSGDTSKVICSDCGTKLEKEYAFKLWANKYKSLLQNKYPSAIFQLGR